jgi:hypothetical protein
MDDRVRAGRGRWVVAGLALAALTMAFAGPAQAAGPFDTFTVQPCRVLDTRFSSPPGPIGGSLSRDVRVVGPLPATQGGAPDCNVPSGATGVFINVVAVGGDGFGHLTVYPFGSGLPLASTINFAFGQTIANGVLVPVCTPFGSCAADVTITMGPAGAHVVIDVTGYVAP